MFTLSPDLTAVTSTSICCCSSVWIRLLLLPQNVRQITRVRLFGFGGRTVERLLENPPWNSRFDLHQMAAPSTSSGASRPKGFFKFALHFCWALVGIRGNPTLTVSNYSNTNGKTSVWVSSCWFRAAAARRCGFAVTSWGQIPEHLPSCIIVLGVGPHGASWPVQKPSYS